MPTVATQTAVADRRRASANYSVEQNARASNISTRRSSSNRYGAIKKTPPEELEEEDDEEEEESQDTSSSSDDSSITRFSDLTGKQWAAVGMLAIANLCSTIAFSCIAPFYPDEAAQKGMTTSEVGVIFGAFELVMFITAPILGKYVSSVDNDLFVINYESFR